MRGLRGRGETPSECRESKFVLKLTSIEKRKAKGAGDRHSRYKTRRRPGEAMGNVANDVHLGGDNPAGANRKLLEPNYEFLNCPKSKLTAERRPLNACSLIAPSGKPKVYLYGVIVQLPIALLVETPWLSVTFSQTL